MLLFWRCKILGLEKVNEKAETSVHEVQSIAILPREFSIATGELGPTLKLKRFYVYEKYKDIIDDLYEEEEEELLAEENVN